ncbi:hypothetical protein LIER_05033 [Lithospermum erythrorhizon]|uniref:Uncharacterized protein n=1 Tax=Lithospermum erythrorhizon TaxID=34254 RepID=A0AAV3NYZ8_LITER
MHKKVFMRIVNDLSSEYEYFTLRYDAAEKVGLSPIQKCTTVIRMLAYRMPGDACDEYVKIDAFTAIECLKQFCKGVIHLYEGIYLRKPNAEDLERLLRVAEDRGFPGMIAHVRTRAELYDKVGHLQLKNDLIHHIWQKFGFNQI